MNLIKEKKALLAAALFLTFTVCLYAPLSIYIYNTQEFWFNLRIIWYVPVLFFLLAFSCCYGLGLTLRGILYKIYLGMVFGLAVCFYIQGNFLGIRIGLIDGKTIDWGYYQGRMALNAIIWVLIIFALTLISVKIEKFHRAIMFLSFMFCVMQAVSLGVYLGQQLTREESVSASVPVYTREGLYEVGSESNIIVIILDTFDEIYYDHVMAESPEILDEYDGFVYYDNFTSVYPTTVYSITQVMSNKIFRNEMTMREWIEEAAKNRMYFDELTDHGYEISLYPADTNLIPDRIRDITTNFVYAPMRFYNMRTCFSLLYRLVGCQYFPDILKPYVWMDGTEIQSTGNIDGKYERFNYSNGSFKSGLDSKGITVKEGAKEFKFIHLAGTHEPYYTDEWGNEAPQSWDYRPVAKGCLRMVSEYIKGLKENGVYDCSTIIITADHGGNGQPGMMSNPFLMIKRENAHHPVETCSYEASLMNFGATIADLAGAEDTSQYGLSIFDLNEDTQFDRYYFQYIWDGNGVRIQGDNGNYYLVEHLTANDTNDTLQFRLTDAEYTPEGEKVPHRENCAGCQESNGKPHKYYTWNCLEHRHRK